MDDDKSLTKFNRDLLVNDHGELIVNAGRYSRGAVLMAFEMIGGMETFAEWASENQTDYYTKMFTKLIGREVEHKSTDSVENMLKILDGEAEIEDITPVEANSGPGAPNIPEAPEKALRRPISPHIRDILVRKGKMYAHNESHD